DVPGRSVASGENPVGRERNGRACGQVAGGGQEPGRLCVAPIVADRGRDPRATIHACPMTARRGRRWLRPVWWLPGYAAGSADPRACRSWTVWGWPGATGTRVSATARYRVSLGDCDLLLVEGDIAAVVLADAVERRRIRVRVTPRCVVMSGALHGDVVI